MSLISRKRSGCSIQKLCVSTILLGGLVCSVAAQERSAPKFELFAGYSYMDPNTAVSGTLPGGVLPLTSCLCAIPRGAGVTGTFNFNRWLGLTADFSGHWSPSENTVPNEVGHASFYNASVGPQLTYHGRHFSPFAEALVGANRLSPELFGHDDRFGVITGGGLDLRVGEHFGFRLAQADYVFSDHQFGPAPTVPATDIRGLRLQSGVVFLFGGHTAQPKQMPATMAPAPAAPVIAAEVAHPLLPPTVGCSANPSSMLAGESSTIVANGLSPSGQPLTYSFEASQGAISASGSSAMLSSAGTSPGSILVTCHVTDDKGRSASATTAVTLTARPLPTVVASQLCSVSFSRDTKRPSRVNNEAKACLDDVALNLERDADATLAVIGHAVVSEGAAGLLAAQRAVNTKAYLVLDKGIDSSRISVFTDPEEGQNTTIMLIPSGATPDLSRYKPVDEQAVRVHPRTAAERRAIEAREDR